MKQNYLTLLLVLTMSIATAQQWIQNLPQDKAQNGELTFYEIQKAFYDYWEPYNVKNGYYEVNGQKIKAPGWKQFKRWEWYWADRVDPQTGKFPTTTAADEYVKYLEQNKGTRSATGDWSNLGTSSSSGGYHGIGRINCVAFRPGTPNTFYVGSPSGGLWKTTDGGASWTVLTDDNTVLGVSDIVVVPTQFQDIIYIATGDKDTGSGNSMGGGQYNDNNSIGVLKSTDGGATWNTTGLSWTVSQKRTISRLILDPNSSNNTLYAATSVGIYKTTDAGANWNLQQAGRFIDMEMNPGSSNTLYASTKDYWNAVSIYYTTNGGSTWSTSKTFASTDYRVELAVTAANNTYVYAIVANRSGGLTSIERSTNSGASFSSVYTAGSSGTWLLGYYCDGTGASNSGQGGYDLCIAANPGNANEVFIGGVNTWKSTDGGTSWSINNMWTSDNTYNSCGAPEVHADKHFLSFQSNSVLFECNDGGIYKTTDGGSTWADLTNGMVISQIYRLGIAQTARYEVINGLQDNGTKNYSAGTWSDVMGGDGMECFIDYTDVNTQYGEYPEGDLRRTTDHWGSKTVITSGLTGTGAWVTPFIIDPNVHTTIYVGYQDVFKSTNQGTSWSKISNWAGNTLRSLAVAPSNSNVICAATKTTLYRTTNGGGAWSDITGSLPTGTNNITYVTIKNNDPNTIWVAMGEYDGNGVFESTDGGANWTNISTGLPQLPVMCVIQNKLNTAQNELYAATDVGVYVKVGGANWASFSNNLPNVMVSELEIYYDNANPANSTLRAATFGRGLWQTELLTTTNTWSGTVSTDWNTAGNWSAGSVPTYANDVIIPNAPNNWPVITGNLTIGSDCNSLSMAAGNTELTITGDLTIISGKTFTVDPSGTATIKVSGNWTDNGTFTKGQSTVEFNGNSNSTITIPSSKTYLINDDFLLWPGNWNGDLGGTSSTPEKFTQASSNNAGDIQPEARFTGSNNNPANGTKRMYHNAVNTSGLSSLTLNFRHYLHDFSGGYTLKVQYSTDAVTWNDVWSVSPSGNIGPQQETVTLTSSQGVGSSTYYISFTITGNLYNLYDWYIDKVQLFYNVTGKEFFNNLTISKASALVSTNGDVDVQNAFIVKPDAWFTNSAGNTLSVAGSFVLEADAFGTASFIDNGTLTITGTSNIQYFCSSGEWHYIASCFDPGSNHFSDFFAGNNPLDFYRWDESHTEQGSTGWWINILHGSEWTTGTFVAAEGYAITDNTKGTVYSFSGNPYNTTKTLAMTKTSGSVAEGWNLVGNPFPGTIAANTNADGSNNFLSANTSVLDNSYTAIYLWDDNAGDYVTISNSSVATFINTGQGFMVKTAADGNNISFTSALRKHGVSTFYKDGDLTQRFHITVIDPQNKTNKAEIVFMDNMTLGLDPSYDAGKYQGNPQLALYSLMVDNNSAELSIQALPLLDEPVAVPVGLHAGMAGNYSFTVEMTNFEDNIPVTLVDHYTAKQVDLRENPVYPFVVEEAGTFNDRFVIFFKSSVGIEDEVNTDQQGFDIYSRGKRITVVPLRKTDSYCVHIFNIVGQEILVRNVSGNDPVTIDMNNSTGYYVVNVQSDKDVITKKVLVK